MYIKINIVKKVSFVLIYENFMAFRYSDEKKAERMMLLDERGNETKENMIER